MEGRWNKLELWDWSDWMMWPTGSKCISWVGPLNKVIPRLIQFHMRSFSQSSTPHIPLHIKSNPWFHMTLQLSLCEIFFSPCPPLRDTLFHGQERCSKTLHQRTKTWPEHMAAQPSTATYTHETTLLGTVSPGDAPGGTDCFGPT